MCSVNFLVNSFFHKSGLMDVAEGDMKLIGGCRGWNYMETDDSL